LAFGVDFRGGIIIEVAGRQAFDLASLRDRLNGLGIGGVEIQDLGSLDKLLIRVEKQEGGEKEQTAAVEKIKATLGSGVEYRRVETVGPKVSGELLRTGLMASGLAVLAIALYVAVRFEGCSASRR
jgi:preprotein translocase subunit SecF